MELVTVTGYI